MYVVITFSPCLGRIVEERVFDDVAQAEEDYRRREACLLPSSDHEVVLIGTGSRETLFATHGHYFGSSIETPWSWILSDLE